MTYTFKQHFRVQFYGTITYIRPLPAPNNRQEPASVVTHDGLIEWLGALLISWRPKRWAITILVGFYISLIFLLILFAVHRWSLAVRFIWYDEPPLPKHKADTSQRVLVQLPVYNEQNVVERLIDATSKLDWPIDRLQIQILDDSNDETSCIIAKKVGELKAKGFHIEHLKRGHRDNYKAGALAWGLQQSEADLTCIFDADFEPPADFLQQIIGHFSDQSVGMVQVRWTHGNAKHSWLTRLQAILLDGHLIVDQGGRYRSRCFFNFNGTAGVWRRQAIEKAGGWGTGTLTEDLDLSYRAQLADWKFVYRPDVEVPAELPENMLGFKAQQRRWSRGSLQTARKLIWQIWRASIPLQCKIEATAHLLSNGVYTLIFITGLLAAPVHIYSAPELQALVFKFELCLLIAGSIAIYFLQSAARVYNRRRGIFGLLYILPIMLLGMGMSVNNGFAAIHGVISQGGVFARTPKYGISRGGHWWHNPYGTQQSLGQLFTEIVFFLYMCFSAFMTWQYLHLNNSNKWHLLIVPVLFTVGIGYVLFMTVKHRFLQNRLVE